MSQRPFVALLPLLGFALIAGACSSGGGGGSDIGFQLVSISLAPDADNLLRINEPITFTFSEPVDFSTVSLNTISIQTAGGGIPATGTFFPSGNRGLVFQPTCPTRADLLDAGLLAGDQDYVLTVLGRSSGASNTVRSSAGSVLQVTQVRNFTTPDSSVAFVDTREGPPTPQQTFVEVGGDPDNRISFPINTELPLNLYGDPDTRIAYIINFDQAVDPSASNVSDQRLRIEYEDGATWLPLETRVTLEGNCTETGARVRLEPIGGLPRDRRIQPVVLAGFRDLEGTDASQSPVRDFAIATVRDVNFTSLTPPEQQSDEFHEAFDFGGDGTRSFQDTAALFSSPMASWDDGRLTAAFDFAFPGGEPSSTFDWVVGEGDEITLDTDNGLITATDGTQQVIGDGLVNVNDMTIEAGGRVRVQGSNPLRILATGDVIIRGILDLSGFSARDVELVNTGNLTEIGGEGGPGGGDGGDANEIVTSSTARGGAGRGPLNEPSTGGGGGESGYAEGLKDTRRPGGGAGGRFALDQGAGLTAEVGLSGVNTAKGAITNATPPRGGALAISPVVNEGLNNDFFGTHVTGSGGTVTSRTVGELPGLRGGYGGGGGGNAIPSRSFPNPNWTTISDEKGGAGGGGGGALHLRALGRIQFGAAGTILCDGGTGAIGESVAGQDHIGGNGGSGSGGHVILETASFIDFTDGGASPGTAARDWISARGGPQVRGAVTGSGNVSFGGAGGPGIIQLHVPDSTLEPSAIPALTDIIVPLPLDTPAADNELDLLASPAAIALVPATSARSFARSKWISIGRADQDPDGGLPALIKFLFQGIDTALGTEEGKILTSPNPNDPELNDVPPLSALLDQDLEGNPDVILQDRVTLEISGDALLPFYDLGPGGVSNDIYLRSTTLLEDFIVQLSVNAVVQDFIVASASYDGGLPGLGDESLLVIVADQGTDLQDFIEANDTPAGTVRYKLIPRFFRVFTGEQADVIPASSYVRVLFQAARDDGTGAPDEGTPLVDWTADINQFNLQSAGELQFFRFEVEFELSADGSPLNADTQALSLDFLRIPFVF